jgi:hypothetical protein
VGRHPDGSFFYFVHSFHARTSDARHSVGEADYGGRFTAAIARDNIFATQFHPEKSADHGLSSLPQLPALDALIPLRFAGYMLFIPAIDLKDGHCVRLKQGDMDQATTFGEDPAAMARAGSTRARAACTWWT